MKADLRSSSREEAIQKKAAERASAPTAILMELARNFEPGAGPSTSDRWAPAQRDNPLSGVNPNWTRPAVVTAYSRRSAS